VTHAQASSPVYWWNNRDDEGALLPFGIADANADYIRLDRDVFAEVEGFDGTAGVGSGPLAARPVACTVDTGYWASDEESLYRCTAPDTWTLHYVAHPYPHPLALP
jgi:hypothetical protein